MADARTRPAGAAPPRATPRVAVVIPSWNGAQHLPACLDSIAALEYPRDLVETIVVDSGSTDGTEQLLAERYAWARVVTLGENKGFAAAANAGARASETECVAFLNNDMRVDPRWLDELVSAYDPAAGYVCVGGVILDWTGERVDFIDAVVSLTRGGMQDRFGARIEDVDVEDGRDLAFACGGSMLIGREVFLELGGFDPAFFAYFEDVDLGWRLLLSGHRIRLAAASRAFHRHQSTGSRAAEWQRGFLLQRNWLRTILKNAEAPGAWRLLTATLLSMSKRAAGDSGSNRGDYAFGSRAQGEREEVDRRALGAMHAVADLVDDLDAISGQRAEIQARRRVSDRDVFARFGRPFLVELTDTSLVEAATRINHALRLDELAAERATTILFADTPRLRALADEASRFARVAVLRSEDQLPEADVLVVAAEAPDALELARGARGLIVVVGSAAPELLALADLCIGEHDDPLPALRELVSEPWRWYERRAAGPARVTEDARELLARWRQAYGVERSSLWHVRRATWRALPPALRRRLRPRSR